MPRNVYSEIYLHITWRTKDNMPMIDGAIENELFKFIKNRCIETPGVYFFTIGGTADHVHLCVSVPPTLLISDWIGELKGASAHHVNHHVQDKALQWQAGYGVVSFGKNNLQFVKEYIEHQKEHHGGGKVHDRLERIEAVEAAGDG
ncbi:MAG TPA: IS200/IS605 family transposase [bacterium]|nr:IS200/IS605 family transposase [bacterium]